METMLNQFKIAKRKYDLHQDATVEIKIIAIACIEMMLSVQYEEWAGPSGKRYLIFFNGQNRSRPFLSDQLMSVRNFTGLWNEFLNSADRSQNIYSLDESMVTKILYNTIVPFCVCFDLWKPKSRKTPGTFFEVVLGTIIGLILPTYTNRTKHIPLPFAVEPNGFAASIIDTPQNELLVAGEEQGILTDSEGEDGSLDMGQVATDIVFDWRGTGIVIPAKITTRERIVQPFAHQRILDGVFGEGRYVSLLMCVSETQRSDNDRRVNEICVPGTITLFQRHLARLGGIYYLDPPERYMALGRSGIVQVQSLGALLTYGLAGILRQLNLTRPAQMRY